MSYEQTIYNQLRKNGISEAGALGLIGNFYCESNCEPYRLQGDFSPYRTQSKAYVQNVMNGNVSKEQFCDGRVGKFIAQWTYPTRQAALWDFWKASGKAIDDAAMQADFVCVELQSQSGLYSFLKNTTDIFTACSRVCREYERPAVNNIDARYQAANRIKYEIDLNAWNKDEPAPTPTPTPTPTPSVDHSLKLRTIDWHCESWDEYDLLVAVLRLRKYKVDDWDDEVWDAVKDFQKENGLTADGIVGNQTWTALLKR